VVVKVQNCKIGARRFFLNEDPIGKRIKRDLNTLEGETSAMREIVGVVGDVRNQSLSTESRPAYYVALDANGLQ
jgi:hypothetical protein